ncbi:MAG: exo-alpha-sialidase, partial [Thermoplasmata archaeon]
MKKSILYCFLILFFLTNATYGTFTCSGQFDDWSEDINLTSNENRSIGPDIATFLDTVHVVYAEDEGSPFLEGSVWYIRSEDNGETWNERIRLDTETVKAKSPKIAVCESKIHVIWLDYNDDSIHYVRSLDNGETWSTEMVIAVECCQSGDYDIAVNDSHVHVSYPTSDHKVSYVSSADDGTTWGTSVKLAPNDSHTTRLAMAVNRKNIYITWKDFTKAGTTPLGSHIYDIFFIKSEDNGLTWVSEINISQTPYNKTGLVDIAVSGANIYITYEQEWYGIYQLFLSYSRDYGNTWVRNVKLTDSTKNILNPSISVENENIYIAWVDRRDGGYTIYFKRSSDYGVTWDTSQRITSIGGCHDPEITANAHWVHVVWWKMWGTLICDDIFYKRHEVPQSQIEATIDIDPDTLNLKSKGRWITVYIEL